MIFDAEGAVLEINEAFTALFGYTLRDGPITPPYPWWPTEQEDPDRRAAIVALWRRACGSGEVDAEAVLYTKDRRPVWVHSSGSSVVHPATGVSARIRVLRDITREKQAQQRRVTAAEVSAAFAEADDLGSLVGCVEHAFGALFDGVSTIQVDVGGPYLFSDGRSVGPAELSADVAAGLAGPAATDLSLPSPGILLLPRSSANAVRAWVQFPRARLVGADELVAGDLLAQAFGLAVDRILSAQRAADTLADLEQAMASHRTIGQAVGILVERHRLTPSDAFDRLKKASQQRKVRLREVALRVVETGTEPDEA